MSRDFTYIDDLVSAVRLLIDVIPLRADPKADSPEVIDSKSPVAPFEWLTLATLIQSN